MVIFIFLKETDGAQWEVIMNPVEFTENYVVAEGFQEQFEGEQGRVAIGVLKNSLNLA